MNSVCRICLGFLADKTGRLNTMFACTFLAGKRTCLRNNTTWTDSFLLAHRLFQHGRLAIFIQLWNFRSLLCSVRPDRRRLCILISSGHYWSCWTEAYPTRAQSMLLYLYVWQSGRIAYRRFTSNHFWLDGSYSVRRRTHDSRCIGYACFAIRYKQKYLRHCLETSDSGYADTI